MRITVDGVDYSPTVPNVGIAATVRNRHDTTQECLTRLREHTPAGVPVVIVDDASDEPFPGADYRFDTNVGIPVAKNKCLELLMDRGVDYLILLDNDCFPVRGDWLDVFVAALDRHPHVSAQFQDLKSAKQLGDIAVIYDDGVVEAWTGQRGYCLAYTRDVVEKVGGFDPVYSPGLYEHSDLANRAHAAGLTTWRYASPKDSHLLVESLDQSLKVERTPLAGRAELVKRNAAIHNERRDTRFADFVEYRAQHDLVLTCLYTGQVDPQRGTRMKADPKALSKLAASAGSHRVEVLNDELDCPDAGNVTYTRYPNAANVYFQRWINVLSRLEHDPAVRNVLVCDGTDVEILQPGRLFENIDPGTLYVGSEFQVVGCEWMINNHPDPVLQAFMAGSTKQLLNAGVVLGSRATVVEFVRAIVHEWERIEAEQFWGKSDGNGVGDMAVFNYVAYTRFADHLEFGPHITTLFKSEQPTGFSLVKHK